MEALQSNSVSQIFLVSAMIMFALVGVIIFFVLVYQKRMIRQDIAMQQMETEHQKQLLNASIASQERERERIAKDLHDEVGAMLSVVKMSLQQVNRKVEGQESVQKLTTETKEIVTETIANVRRISKDLMPLALLKVGLDAALEELFSKIDSMEGLITQFEAHGEAVKLPPSIALGLYRVVQEALNNCLKHAEATQIVCRLHFLPHQLKLIFEDNGKGFDMEKLLKNSDPTQGIGIKNIASRVSMLSGSWKHESEANKGTKLHISIPLHLLPQNTQKYDTSSHS